MTDVSRVEKKYAISMLLMYWLRPQFERLLRQDEHNGDAGYCVRSLYFDTFYDDDYEDKESGIECRRKIRLRIYHPEDRTAQLELKEKQGENQRKRAIALERAQVRRLIDGDFTPLLEEGSELGKEFYYIMNQEHYVPRSIVEYDRIALIGPANEVRITFDQRVRATESSLDFFSPALPLYPVIDPDDVILEVKYNHFLFSYIRDVLSAVARNQVSIGKYSLSRSIGHANILL